MQIIQTRPRDRATQSPDLGQAIVQIILPTRPCNRTRTRNRANQSPSVGCGHVHPCCRLRLNRPSTATFLTHHASIHPQFLKGRIRQPPCSDQRTDTCSRNLMKHKRSPLKRVELSTESKIGQFLQRSSSCEPQEEKQTGLKSSCLRTVMVASSLKLPKKPPTNSL